MTEEDQLIVLAQMRRSGNGGGMLFQEHRCSGPEWKDAHLMRTLTWMRHDFKIQRLALASGLSERAIKAMIRGRE